MGNDAVGTEVVAPMSYGNKGLPGIGAAERRLREILQASGILIEEKDSLSRGKSPLHSWDNFPEMPGPRHETNPRETAEKLLSKTLGHTSYDRHERTLFETPVLLKTPEHAQNLLFRLAPNTAGYKEKKRRILRRGLLPPPGHKLCAETIRIVHVHLASEDYQRKSFHP
jgi:hypothetical protein